MERPDHKKSCTHSLPEAWQGLAHPAHRSTCKVWVDCFSRNCEELNFNSAKLCKVEENIEDLKKIFHLCEVEGIVYLCEVEDSDMADVVERRSRSETLY